MERNKSFSEELKCLLNRYSVDNELNIADFILTDFIDQSLDTLKAASRTGLYNPIPVEKIYEKVLNERDRLKKGNLKEDNGCAVASHPSPLLAAVNNQQANEYKAKEELLNNLKVSSDLIIQRATLALSPAEQAGLGGALVKIFRHYQDANPQSF